MLSCIFTHTIVLLLCYSTRCTAILEFSLNPEYNNSNTSYCPQISALTWSLNGEVSTQNKQHLRTFISNEILDQPNMYVPNCLLTRFIAIMTFMCLLEQVTTGAGLDKGFGLKLQLHPCRFRSSPRLWYLNSLHDGKHLSYSLTKLATDDKPVYLATPWQFK